jgi:proline iminopeptidase
MGFILRGIFLFSEDEVNWFLYGMKKIFPEYWEKFANHVDGNNSKQLLNKYYNQLNHRNPNIHNSAAAAWCNYESSCSRLLNNTNYNVSLSNIRAEDLAMARIEAHYMIHKGFLKKNQIIKEIDIIQSLPSIIIQGRYDIICPISTALKLSNSLSNSELRVVPNAGHSSMEVGIKNELVKATNEFKKLRN